MRRLFVVLLSLLTVWNQPFARKHNSIAVEPVALAVQLGSVNFSTSCSAGVQTTINEAIALLHSFQYQQSKSEFENAAKQDSKCAMAYWGEAMSLYHQLWDFPNRETLATGHGYVEQAQKLSGKTERERDYVAAAAAFYATDSKLSHTARVEGYTKAMEEVYKDSPQDVDAVAFYGLALVNLAYEEDGTVNRKKAIALLEPALAQYPDHPGLAHYLIHATDTAELAPQGLAAARSYARIAPDSSHALHMPSHIFTRVGLWQESIDSNVAAAASAAKATEAHQADADYELHALDFLNYAYLQSGQEGKARQVVAELKSVPGASAEDLANHESWFEARDALELHRWKEAAALKVPDVRLGWLDSTYFARTIGAARSGDVKAAKADQKKLGQAVSAQRHESKHMGYGSSSAQSVEQEEAEAWIEFAEGKTEAAVKMLRSAAEREASEINSLTMPANEMLGDMLLELKRPAEGLEAYRAALKQSSNRFDGIWGAAQAALASGNLSAAKEYYSKLVEISGTAADRPELQEARGYLAAK